MIEGFIWVILELLGIFSLGLALFHKYVEGKLRISALSVALVFVYLFVKLLYVQGIQNSILVFLDIAIKFNLVVSFFFINRKFLIAGFYSLFTGIGLNAVTILFNGGKMPVVLAASEITSEMTLMYTSINDSTCLPWLSDIINLSYSEPGALILSLGDILMIIGLYLAAFEIRKK